MLSVAVCERLAGLARSGFSVRGALVELRDRIESDRGDLCAVARRARLGAPIDRCLEPLAPEFGEALPELRACLSAAAMSGANWAEALDKLGNSISDRAALRRSADVAGAGAKLSARVIAALPLLMLPAGLRQVTDGVVAGSIFLGLCIGVVGYRWLVRVIPAPPPDDAGAVVADEVAASLDLGSSLDEALGDALERRAALRRAARRAALGMPWSAALSIDLPPVAAAIADAETTGTPVAESLRRTAASVRRDARLRFQREVQRAPVKMVLPLVSCCLPSFVLITIVPLLRGLSRPV